MRRHAVRHPSILCLGALLTLGGAEAHAAEEAPSTPLAPDPGPPARASFGQRGQMVLSTGASLWIEHESMASTGTTTVLLDPAVDVFVADHLSLGGSASFGYSTSHEPSGTLHTTSYGIGPRVGYDIPLSPRLSLWPRATFAFQTEKFGGSEGPPSHFSNEDLELSIPVLFHPAAHFFAGFGPFAGVLFPNQSGETKSTVVGARLIVGGWTGL